MKLVRLRLVSGINEFIERLQNIMKDIKEQSDNIKEASDNIGYNISEVNNNAVNVSAAMQQMAAGILLDYVDESILSDYERFGNITEYVRVFKQF